MKIFYSPKQNVPDNDSFSPSAGKPIAWNLAGGYQSPIGNVLELHLATMEECIAAFEPPESPAAFNEPENRIEPCLER